MWCQRLSGMQCKPSSEMFLWLENIDLKMNGFVCAYSYTHVRMLQLVANPLLGHDTPDTACIGCLDNFTLICHCFLNGTVFTLLLSSKQRRLQLTFNSGMLEL